MKKNYVYLILILAFFLSYFEFLYGQKISLDKLFPSLLPKQTLTLKNFTRCDEFIHEGAINEIEHFIHLRINDYGHYVFEQVDSCLKSKKINSPHIQKQIDDILAFKNKFLNQPK